MNDSCTNYGTWFNGMLWKYQKITGEIYIYWYSKTSMSWEVQKARTEHTQWDPLFLFKYCTHTYTHTHMEDSRFFIYTFLYCLDLSVLSCVTFVIKMNEEWRDKLLLRVLRGVKGGGNSVLKFLPLTYFPSLRPVLLTYNWTTIIKTFPKVFMIQ